MIRKLLNFIRGTFKKSEDTSFGLGSAERKKHASQAFEDTTKRMTQLMELGRSVEFYIKLYFDYHEHKKELSAKPLESFEVSKADFTLLNDGLRLNVKISEGNSPNELLSYLTSQGQVHHFVELVPDANDIFIQAVNKNNGENE